MSTEQEIRPGPDKAAVKAPSANVTAEARGFGWVAGNLVNDPDVRYSNTGRCVVKLRVASSNRVRDPESGQWREGPVRFIDVTCFGTLAENVAEHLRKGDRVVGGGRWQYETWTSQDDKQHERYVLMARDLGPSVTFRAARYITDIDKGL